MTKDTEITLEEANNNILLTLDFCKVTLDVFHAEDGYRRREALKEEYKNPPENRRNYVIRKGIDKIGVVAIESILSSTSEIRGLALKPEFRGMGYLPRIIEAIEEKIRENGANKAALQALGTLPEAYRGMGYKYGTYKVSQDPGAQMTKTLG